MKVGTNGDPASMFESLKQSLEATVESCVNRVGVDLNTASWALLRYVAGINERTASNLVAWRNQNGRFRSRAELGKVPGLGPKTFEQAAGFLRIRDGKHPLDNTAVHPERYQVVEAMASDLGATLVQLVSDPAMVGKIDLKRYVTDSVGLPTLIPAYLPAGSTVTLHAENGIAGPANLVLASDWYKKAADQGHVEAQKEVAKRKN